ncbi:hypothetical protein JHK84_049276 [Glycine max]|nr:hypothetical protein JHK84_049276 [Glycine max]
MPQLLKLLALTLIWWSSNIVEYFFFAADILGATELKGPVSFEGLAYLHEGFHVSIIHRDIKTGNILLDDDLQPKIADFELARLLSRDRSHLSTKFAGTLRYTAPEYAMQGQLSEKADTYSYGIVVLEIISGQKSTNVKVDDEGREYLLQQAWKLYERGMQLELVDKDIDLDEYDAEEMNFFYRNCYYALKRRLQRGQQCLN